MRGLISGLDRVGCDDSNGLAVVTRLFHRQHRSVFVDRTEAWHRLRQIRCGKYAQNPGHIPRCFQFDMVDPGPRDRKGNKFQMRHVVELEIGKENL